MTFLSQTQHACRPAPTRRAGLKLMLSVYRQRRALAKLDARALKDIGITAEEARIESRRPFWDFH